MDKLVFDTFSAMVAAIQKYDTLYGDTCEMDNLCLDDFNYQQTNITSRLREILTKISFQGMLLKTMQSYMNRNRN